MKRLGIALLIVHAVITLVHGLAHDALAITMFPWQNAYILIVITLMPLVAGFLLWRNVRSGFLILALSMLGSLTFGGYYHFIQPGHDNVAHLPLHVWTVPFQITALLLAVSELTGMIVGILGPFRNAPSE